MNTFTVQSESFSAILTQYESDLQQCRHHIVAGLQADTATALLARYFSGGKFFRACLVFLATAATGGDPKKLIPAAAAVELLHTASLIHDDIVDEATVRRGRPALHVHVGMEPALVLGDYLILQAFAVLREAEAAFEVARVLEALHALNHYARACCLGELGELPSSSQTDLEEEYLAIARGKTASPFAAAATLPVILNGGSTTDIEALRTYGLNLGIAMQIRDDILDLTGDAQVLGKPVGNSLARGRPLLPLIYLDHYGSLAGRREYLRIQQRGNERVALLVLLKEEGILNRVESILERHLSAALQALECLPCSDEVVPLRVLAHFATSHSSGHHLMRTRGYP
jgi:geranylgeranyl pyrophosphate synthase